MTDELTPSPLHQGIRDLLLVARTQVRQTVNTAMVQTYWHIGRMIVELPAVLSHVSNSLRSVKRIDVDALPQLDPN